MPDGQRKAGDELIIVQGDEVSKSSSEENKTIGKIFLTLFILCIMIILLMLINKARAHLVVKMDNQFNELFETAEIYKESETTNADEVSEVKETTEYESIIPDKIVEEAAKNNVTVEKQIENTYNSAHAKFLASIALIAIMAVLLSRVHG